MNNPIFQITVLSLLLTTTSCNKGHASCNQEKEYAVTEAGKMDLNPLNHVKLSSAFHKIAHHSGDKHYFDLEDGSRWSISKTDTVEGWDRCDHLVITQNHAALSTARYALLNPDLKQAIPVSLVREPIPGNKNVFYIKSIDLVNDIVTLNDNKNWIVHSADRDALRKISEHDRVIIGMNSNDNWDKTPYILVDTSNKLFVRAKLLEN